MHIAKMQRLNAVRFEMKENQIKLVFSDFFATWVDKAGKRAEAMSAEICRNKAESMGYVFSACGSHNGRYFEIWELPESEQLR